MCIVNEDISLSSIKENLLTTTDRGLVLDLFNIITYFGVYWTFPVLYR